MQEQSPHRDGKRSVSPASRAYYLWDVSTGLLNWGGNCVSILRRNPAEMPRTLHEWLTVTHVDDRGDVEAVLGRFLTDRNPVRIEYRIHRLDQLLPISFQASFTTDRLAVGSVGKSAQSSAWDFQLSPTDDLSVNEPNPGLIETGRFFELSEDLLCVAGMNGYFRKVNPAFTRVLGYEEAELLAQPYLNFVHPDDRLTTMAETAGLRHGQTTYSFRNRYIAKSGKIVWLEWVSRSVPQEDAVFAVARDVSQRLELEEKLIFQEARERSILDNTTAVIYIKNPAGQYEFVNQQFAKLFNVTPANVVGKTDMEVFPPAFAAKFQVIDKQVILSGEQFEGEEVAPHADGPHTYITVKFPLRNDKGDVVSVAGISTDITDRIRGKEVERQIQTARQVQQKLYPASPPSIESFDIASRWQSASQLCGDYFDFIQRPGGRRFVTCVGDICGHGLGPALQMVETRAMLRLLLQSNRSLQEVLNELNRQLCSDMPEDSYVTLFLAEIDLDTRLLRYEGAAHIAHLLRATGENVRLSSTGPMVGTLEQWESESVEPIRINSGDVLLLFTDGLNEATSPSQELFGFERIVSAARAGMNGSALHMIETLFTELNMFTANAPAVDDVTAIVLKAL